MARPDNAITRLKRNNVRTKRTIAITIMGLFLIPAVFMAWPLAASQMTPMDGEVPHYFGPYPNYATSQLPDVTYDVNGDITSVIGGIRKFVDSLPGLGEANVNNLGQYMPIAIPDKASYLGSDYYEIGLVEFEEQMHSDLNPDRKSVV